VQQRSGSTAVHVRVEPATLAVCLALKTPCVLPTGPSTPAAVWTD